MEADPDAISIAQALDEERLLVSQLLALVPRDALVASGNNFGKGSSADESRQADDSIVSPASRGVSYAKHSPEPICRA